jgi:ectoine hydroxylase-related dioxygenase (phytanoyl-CoA dioxygenase family)
MTRQECERLCSLLPTENGAAGTRNLLGQSWCVAMVDRLRTVSEVRAVLPPHSRAVQCSLFVKTPKTNWSVGFHRDLSIPVSARVANSGCAGWSEKEGILYTQPPRDVLDELVALRVNLDDCGPDNGPLRVIPGSHKLGHRLESAGLREEECIGPAGSAVVLSPLLLHASSKAREPKVRRVLHFLFGPPLLRYGLRWKQSV